LTAGTGEWVVYIKFCNKYNNNYIYLLLLLFTIRLLLLLKYTSSLRK
jgi:hypothetical protein